jgi:hypothetical protein
MIGCENKHKGRNHWLPHGWMLARLNSESSKPKVGKSLAGMCICTRHFLHSQTTVALHLASNIGENGAIMETLYYTILGALVMYPIYQLLRIGHRPKDFPPGPPTLPILGNIHLVRDSVLRPPRFKHRSSCECRWPKKTHISSSKNGHRNTAQSIH